MGGRGGVDGVEGLGFSPKKLVWVSASGATGRQGGCGCVCVGGFGWVSGLRVVGVGWFFLENWGGHHSPLEGGKVEGGKVGFWWGSGLRVYLT